VQPVAQRLGERFDRFWCDVVFPSIDEQAQVTTAGCWLLVLNWYIPGTSTSNQYRQPATSNQRPIPPSPLRGGPLLFIPPAWSTQPLPMPYVITEACIGVKDKSCVDVCPVDCIYEGEQMLFIHPDECIDCGACEPECPVTAIFPEEDVPGNLKQYIEKNKEVFTSDNPPGRPTK
jgi:NAD-dependent dihydropyrimidine dehydrogenase PreA subunit